MIMLVNWFRAHRLGRYNAQNRGNRRPIIVNFRDFCDTELIMEKAYMLKGSGFSTDHDLPREIQSARSKLWPHFKKLKLDHPRAKVSIVYPAKLLMDGKLIIDALPEWSRYMSNSRVVNIENVDSEVCNSEHSYANVVKESQLPTISVSPSQNADSNQRFQQFGNPFSSPYHHQMLQGPLIMFPNPNIVNTPVTHGDSIMNTQPCSSQMTYQDPNVVTSHVTTSGISMDTQPCPSQVTHTTPEVNNHQQQHSEHQATSSDSVINMCLPVTNEDVSISLYSHPFVSSGESTVEDTTPKSAMSPPRGRARIVRSTARSEKRSESARPYKCNASSSRSKSRPTQT